MWLVVGPQQIYESLQLDSSRCFDFWIGCMFLVVSREYSRRDKLSLFQFLSDFQERGTSAFSVVAILYSRTFVHVRIHDHLREVDDQHHNVCISQVCQRSLLHAIE